MPQSSMAGYPLFTMVPRTAHTWQFHQLGSINSATLENST